MMRASRALGLAALVVTGALAEQMAWGVFDSAVVPTGSSLKVLRVVPEGNNVPAPGRQIVVTFDRPVKALGDLSVPIAKSPVSVSPAIACQWHWLDARSVGCELDAAHALAPATRYTVTVASGLKAQDDAALEDEYRWSFTTERPAITQYSFRTWRSPGTPQIRLVFNQPVTRDTVQADLHFSATGSVIATPDPFDREVFFVLALPGEPGALVLPAGTAPVKSDERTTVGINSAGQRIEARRVWLVSPSQELPGNATLSLKVAPGLRSYAGPLPGIERRTVVSFDTFPAFRLLGVRCLTGSTSTLIPASMPKEAQPACNPFGAVSLVFSAPVIAPEVRDHLVLIPDLLNGRTDYDPWQNIYASSHLGSSHKRGTEYAVELPEHLRAFQPYSIASLTGLRDEFDRPLSGPAAMEFRTDHRPPRLKVTHPVAVLEKNAPTSMPLYVTNLTDIDIHYRKLTSTGAAADLRFQQRIDRAWDTAYATPARLRELLEGHSGVVTGYFDPHPSAVTINGYRYFDEENSDPGLPRGQPDRDFFAEVTPFQVHTKIGAYNTLVWVTSLEDGRPVAQARVQVFRDSYQGLSATQTVLARGVTDRDGLAVLAGRKWLEHESKVAPGPKDSFMVRVDSGEDMALLPLDGTFLVDLYRASRGTIWSGSDFGSEQNHAHAWGTTAQGVYKLGDTVEYKVYLRDQNNLSLAAVTDRSGYELTIIDPTGKVVQTEHSITLSEFGAYAGSFHVPLAGTVGWYEFNLKGPGASGNWNPMKVLIADFTPAPFQVSNTLNGQLFQPGDSVEVATRATLHAGGPYASASSRITARLFPQSLDIATPIATGFEFASVDPPGDCMWKTAPDVLMVHQSDATTSDTGEFSTRFALPEASMLSARLEVESAVRDERGKYVANRSYAEFRGRDRFVGLRHEHWTLEEGKPATVQYLVVDKSGKVVPGEPVSVSVAGQIVQAARVKGAGSAYLTSYQPQWQPDGSCSGTSATAAQTCTFTPSHPGLYSVMASVKDTHGNVHKTELCSWVTGKGRILWEEPADMSLSIIPEKESYKVGEHARYLVKNPFPGARALITIERYGVIKHWVQILSGNTPVIDFKVEPDFVPGFYLSVVVMSPRVAPVPGTSPLNTDGVDLGRPTYRIGYLKVQVTDPYKTLDVRIKSDRTAYKPHDTVELQLAAAAHASPAPKEPVEFAVVVLDEAVFDLIKDGKTYFDPYKGLYHLDDLDLSNYSLLTRLIGLQKFEKKGANSGGDGGAGFDMRTVNKYVAYWNPSVRADRHGRAVVSFQLPDNLTGWRVFAIAVTPERPPGLGRL